MPTLIFDGDCGFCRHWVRWLQARTGSAVRYAPYQEVAHEFPAIPREHFQKAVQFVDGRGVIHSGANAIFVVLSHVPGHRTWDVAYRRVPGFAPLSEAFYRLVASNRYFFSRVMKFMWGTETMPATHGLVANLYLRVLGAVYLVAFLSLGVQLPGLVGSRGVLPAAEFLTYLRSHYGSSAYLYFPTLAWISPSDAMLYFLAWGGAAVSLALIGGVAPRVSALLAWLGFLSLATVGNVFTQYQWEALLLEAGFLALFVAPLKRFQGFSSSVSPPLPFIWLHRWLLFRLIFASGIAKLTSGDETWRNLTALAFHYETQPLPTPLAWHVHGLPAWFHQISSALMFFLELVVPLFFFFPRRVRKMAFFLSMGLQVVLMLTGNFAYFNLLAMALCLFLLEDRDVTRFFPKGAPLGVQRKATALLVTATAGVLFFLSVIRPTPLAEKPGVKHVLLVLDRAQILNAYGLFANMTTTRYEIQIEGSNDQKEWLTYEFRWKPGDPFKRPKWVAPYQPRLDWQMWFAALSSFDREPWLQRMSLRLLEGEPAVLRLLARNPFPEKPPKYLRLQRYVYKFTDDTTRDRGWWIKQLEGPYSPVISREHR